MANKVLFTASTFSHIRNFHLPYIKWFHDMGWQVHVACGGKAEHIERADRIIELPFQKKMIAPGNFSAASILRRLIRDERYSLISTHTALAAFFTRLAVKGMRGRPPVVNIVHGYLFDDDTPKGRRAVLTAAERMTAGETDLLLTMNRWDYRFASERHLGRRVVNIPGMGVDFTRCDRFGPKDGKALRREQNIPEDAFVLIYPAEFSQRKSQRVLIEAMARLPESCVLALPGQGALLDECKNLANKLGLTRRVVFPGQVARMGPWYAASDAAVTASRGEGLPFNVMEAMRFALPVVASRVKGHTDLISHGDTGLMYPYGDVDACADAVRSLMESDRLRAALGKAARESSERFSLERVAPEIMALYAGMLNIPIVQSIMLSR